MLKPDSGVVIEFQGFNPVNPGFNSENVTISSDDFVQDNSKTFVQKITADAFNYGDSMPVWHA